MASGRLQQVKIESDGSLSAAGDSEQAAIEDVELIGPDHEDQDVEPAHSRTTVRSQVSGQKDQKMSGFSIAGSRRKATEDSPVVRKAKNKVDRVLRAEVDATSVDMQTTTKRHAMGGRFQKNAVVDEGEEDEIPSVPAVPVPVKNASLATIKVHSMSSKAVDAPAPAPLVAFEDDADEPAQSSANVSAKVESFATTAENASLATIKAHSMSSKAVDAPAPAPLVAFEDDADEPAQSSANVPAKVESFATSERPRIVQTMKSMSGGAFYLLDLCFGEGDNEQCFAGIPDTGSFEIVVRSTLCQQSGCTGPMYNSQLSSTFSADDSPNATVLLTYGSGPVVTESGFETVCVGHSEGGLCSPHQHILSAKSTEIDALRDGEIIGIFGVGRGDSSGFESRFLTQLGVERYSVCLATNETHDGQFVWNDDDVSNNASFTKIDIFGIEHWAARLTNMKLHLKNGTALGNNASADLPLDCESGCGAILDSGTTFITPPQQTLTVLSQYMAHNNFTCEDWQSLPDLKFTFGDNEYTLPPNAYIALVDVGDIPDWLKDKLHFKPAQHHTCMFLFIDPIQTQTQQGPAMIMGMPFFRYYYTSFDYKKKEVYAAPHSHCQVGGNAISSWQAPPMKMNFGKLLPRDQKMALGSIV
jgi:hypothetical protein